MSHLNVAPWVDYPELPKYRSKGLVEALKIKDVSLDVVRGPFGQPKVGPLVVTLTPEDDRYPPFQVTQEYWARHLPKASGYWIRYDNGYETWALANDFELTYRSEASASEPDWGAFTAVISQVSFDDKEIDAIACKVTNQLMQENAGVIGGPDIVHMQWPKRFAKAITEASFNKLVAEVSKPKQEVA